VNSPSTHGSVGLTTGLDPAMTLGCGAVGGNITSDNISPMHLINIKRVAYEIRPAQQVDYSEGFRVNAAPSTETSRTTAGSLEDKIAGFLDQRGYRSSSIPQPAPNPKPSSAPPKVKEPDSTAESFGEHKIYPINPPKTSSIPNLQAAIPGNPHSNPQVIGPVDFVCEDDVRKALAARKIIAIHKKTIITPAARDLASNQNLFKRID